jgi:ABC-type transport system involved in multi-copper enzyme maturation permease subunit
MNAILAISGVVIRELYRRKDFYVLFVMTAIITLVMGSVTLFNDDKIARYITEICLLLIWVSSLVVAIGTTARQLPAERENRTIFPLLAKPVTRAQVILGKFAGCWFACGLALAVFYTFFIVVSGSRQHEWPMGLYAQALWLHWMLLGVVVGVVLLGSVVFSAPSANSTICFAVVVGILLLGRHLQTVALQQPGPIRLMLSSVYFAIPHLEWYDIRDLVVYHQPPVPWIDFLLASLYAMFYMGVFLAATWGVFRRKPLTL